jgi:hypothetical protein
MRKYMKIEDVIYALCNYLDVIPWLTAEGVELRPKKTGDVTDDLAKKCKQMTMKDLMLEYMYDTPDYAPVFCEHNAHIRKAIIKLIESSKT